MLKKIIGLVVFIAALQAANAQMYDAYVHKGELGASIGLGHYFGDLNTNVAINKPKFSAGVYYLKQFNGYVGMKIDGSYTFLGFSDANNSNVVHKTRNLSFNTDLYELSVSGYFNFFKFLPGFREYSYTPYVSLGVGVFSYDPYAYLEGEKYYLRSIGTEGQGSTQYPERTQYGGTAMSIPLSFGFKYAINERMNWYAEVSYRFTGTDYLDDVSTTYAGPLTFPADPITGQRSIADKLQDRSYEVTGGLSIGDKGRQRGNSTQNDGFATFRVGLSFNLQSYKCPKAK
ncbi:MAG: DUF6089 family protein [Flavobacterium sp.]|nr:DUF6089 family protein [Flavobacterium sp.]